MFNCSDQLNQLIFCQDHYYHQYYGMYGIDPSFMLI